jgi:hypothetical protein
VLSVGPGVYCPSEENPSQRFWPQAIPDARAFTEQLRPRWRETGGALREILRIEPEIWTPFAAEGSSNQITGEVVPASENEGRWVFYSHKRRNALGALLILARLDILLLRPRITPIRGVGEPLAGRINNPQAESEVVCALRR